MSTADKIVLEILEPALESVQRCPVDSKVIDGTFQTLSCPVCETAFCTFPCAEKLASRGKRCPVCKEFEMSKLAEIIQNITYTARLEDLRISRRVSDQVYDKLRLEYEIRQRDAMARVYRRTPQKDGGTRQGPLRCDHCGNEGDYIEQYDRWYCYKCRTYLPESG